MKNPFDLFVGAKGARGHRGHTGEKGQQGERGDRGPPGESIMCYLPLMNFQSPTHNFGVSGRFRGAVGGNCQFKLLSVSTF